jgi:hypothetical protein
VKLAVPPAASGVTLVTQKTLSKNSAVKSPAPKSRGMTRGGYVSEKSRAGDTFTGTSSAGCVRVVSIEVHPSRGFFSSFCSLIAY